MKTKEFVEFVVTANGRPVCGFRNLELARKFVHDYESRETGETVSLVKHVYSVLDVSDTSTAES